jgi:succinate dehydrogenase / fumarate reductase, cytochrome b subunit
VSTVAPPTPATRSRLARFLTSTIGLKLVMAVSGVALCAFVLGHMAGNLNAFAGAEKIDAYGQFLHSLPAALWATRLGLLAAVGLHVWAYAVLTLKSQAARPHGYRVHAYKESSYASRSMRITGPILLVFVVYHLLHFTTGTVHPDFREGEVYHNVVTGLSAVPVVLFYLLAMACLALHLWHGVWSLFQTLGANQPRWHSFGRRVATGFTLVVVLGFSAVPLAVLTGFLK